MKQIDERIVQMRMENGVFEKAAELTINTLNKIKESLNFGTTGKQFAEDINNAAETVDVSKLASAVETVSNRFSALGVIGITALQNITNSVIDTARTMINELTIAPIKQGYDEYELKLGSVQTIMASTGATLKEVNGYLEELNTYADKTIYSFSDMTSNIGKFTNAGVELEPAVKAIQGISNVAAVSGATAENASHAMYNFAQALSSGYVKLIDWKSIEIANMATVEFKQQLLDSALALGTVRKEGDKYVTTTTNAKGQISEAFDAVSMFNDSLNHQWMTTEVLVDTLGRYADENTEIGKKAFAAAQDIKTFTQLMDTLKEAVGSGWAQTFELIFGDFEEAKELWTDVNNVVGTFIDNMSKSRNKTLQFWHDNGGRKEALEGLANVFKGLQSIIEPISEAWKEMFPAITGERLVEISKKFAEATKNFKLNDVAATGLKSTVKLLLIPLKLLMEVAKIGLRIGGKVIIIVGRISEGILTLIGYFVNAVKWVKNFISELGIFQNIMDAAGRVLDYFEDKLEKVINPIKDFFEAFLNSPAISKIIQPFKGIRDSLEDVYEYASGKVINAFEELSKISPDDMIQGLKDIKKGAEDVITTFLNFPIVQDAIDGATRAFNWGIDSIVGFYDAGKKLGGKFASSLIKWLSSFDGLDFSTFTSGIKNLTTRVTEYFDSMKGLTFTEKIFKIGGDAFNFAKKGFNSLLQILKGAVGAVHDFWVMFTGEGKLLIFEEGGMVSKAINTIKSFGGAFKDFLDWLDIGEKLKAFGSMLWEFATDVVSALQNLDYGAVLLFGFSVAVIFLMVSIGKAFSSAGRMFDSIGGLGDSLSDFIKNIGKNEKTGSKIKALAIAIIALTASLAILSMIDSSALLRSIAVISGALITIVALSAIMGKMSQNRRFSNGMKAFSQNVLMLSVSILAITAALKLMEYVSLDDAMFDRITVIGMIAVAMAGLGILIGRYQQTLSKGSIFLVAYALSITQVVRALMLLNGITDVNAMREGVIWVSSMMVAFAILAQAASQLKLKSSLGVLLLVASVALLEKVVKKIADMKMTWDEAKKALPSMAMVIGTLSLLMLSTKAAGSHALQGAISVLIISKTIDSILYVVDRITSTNSTWDEAGKTVLKMIGLFGSIALLMASTYFAGKYAIRGGIAIAIISASSLLLGQFIENISKISKDKLTRATIVLALIEVLAIGMMVSMKALEHVEPKSISRLTFALAVLMGGLAIMTLIDPERLVSASVSLGVALIGFATVLKTASNLRDRVAISNIIFLCASMAVAAGSLKYLASVEWQRAIAAGVALSITLLSLAAATRIADAMDKKAILSLLAVSLMTAAAVVALATLSTYDWPNILSAAVSLSATMLALAAATRIVGIISSLKGIGALALVAAESLIAAGSLAILSSFPWTGILASAAALSATMLALAAATRIASANIGGAAAMAILSVALIAVSSALRLLADISGEHLKTSVIALAAALVVLGVAGYALQGVDIHILLISAALVVVAAAAWIFAQAVSVIVKALLLLRDVSETEAINIGNSFAMMIISALLTLIKQLPEIVAAFRESARLIIAGFIQGILDSLGALAESAAYLFKVPFEIIKKLWDMHSPSVVAAGLGYNVDAGFTLGMLSGIPGIENASYLAASSSYDSFAEGLGDFGSLGLGSMNDFFGSLGNGDSFNLGFDYGDLFSGGLEESLGNLGDLGDLLGNNFMEGFTWNPEDLYSSFFNSGQSSYDGLFDGSSGMSGLSSDFLNQYLESFSTDTSYSTLFNFGESGTEGFNSGFNIPETSSLFDFDSNDFFNQMFNFGQKGAEGANEGFNSKLPKRPAEPFVESINDGLKNGKVNAMPMTDKISSQLETSITRSKKIGKDTADGFNESVSGIGKPIYEVGETWIKAGKDLKKGADTAAENSGKSFRTKFDETIDARNLVKEQSTKFRDSFKDPSNTIRYAKSGADTAGYYIGGYISQLPEGEKQAAVLATSMLAAMTEKNGLFSLTGWQYATNVATGMGLKIYDVATIGAKIATAGLEPLKLNEPQATISGSNTGENYATGMGSKGWSVQTAAQQLVGVGLGILGANYQNFYNSGSSNGAAVASGLNSQTSSAYNSGSSLGSNALSGISSALANTASIGINAGQGLVNGLNAKEGEVRAAAAALANAAAAAMQAALDIHSPSKVAESMGENTGAGLENGLEKAAESAGKNALNYGSQLGEKVEQGINNGTKKVTDSVSNAGGKLGGAAINGLNKNLMIHSPSRLAEQSGEWMGIGFAKGIQNMSSYIDSTTGDMGETAISGLQAAIKLANEALESDVNAVPIITPVIDLSNISNGAEEINQMLNNKTLRLSSFTLDNVNATARAMSGFKEIESPAVNHDNADVIQAIRDLGINLDGLKEFMSGMKVMLNGTALVGQILPDVDRGLARRQTQYRRGN